MKSLEEIIRQQIRVDQRIRSGPVRKTYRKGSKNIPVPQGVLGDMTGFFNSGKPNVEDFLPFGIMKVADFEFYDPVKNSQPTRYIHFTGYEEVEDPAGGSIFNRVRKLIGIAKSEPYGRCFRFIMDMDKLKSDDFYHDFLKRFEEGNLYFKIKRENFKSFIGEEGFIHKEFLKSRYRLELPPSLSDGVEFLPKMDEWPVYPDYELDTYVIRDLSAVEFIFKIQ